MSKLQPTITADGSSTLYHPELDEHYHSVHGAYAESMHVFIRSGLHVAWDGLEEVKVLEVGFGTGLNAWLTAMEAVQAQKKVHYMGLEYQPLAKEVIGQLHFPQLHQSPEGSELWQKIHDADWDKPTATSPWFEIQKVELNWTEEQPDGLFDLIYYDAFAPNKQPEMWTPDLFEKAFKLLSMGGVWVTYTAKGAVRRGLQEAGFHVERIPGPPGKREMIRAWKINQ